MDFLSLCNWLAVGLIIFAANGGAQSIPGEWQAWTKCTKECEGGTQERLKKCPGLNIPCGKIVANCNLKPCDDPYSDSVWSDCSADCNNGTRWRDDENDENRQSISCNTHACSTIYDTCIGDFVFVVDSSGSIGFKNWFIAKQFIMDLIKGLVLNTDDTRIGLIVYSTMSKEAYDIDQFDNIDDMVDETWKQEYMAGVTNTADGIMDARKMLEINQRPGKKQFIVVVTDGESNVDKERTITEADIARKANITVFAITVGQVNDVEIAGIANDPDSAFIFSVDSFGEVQRMTSKINEELCSYTNVRKCDECQYSACSKSCGNGTQTGEKQCWTVDKLTQEEIANTRENYPCPVKNCYIKDCSHKECSGCEYSECSVSCDDGIQTGKKECWQASDRTQDEVDGTREVVDCPDLNCNLEDCTHKDCSDCDYSECSVSCDDGIQTGKKECWQVSDTTQKEVDGTREVVNCPDLNCNLEDCTHKDCSDCDYSECSVSCDDGIQTGKKECWQVSDRTQKEIDGTRKKVDCPDLNCNLEVCTHEVCSDCEYSPCSKTCDEGGIQTGEKQCWQASDATNEEIDNSRVTVQCDDKPCFLEVCTTPAPFEPNCSRCDFTKGQIWLPNPFNCHLYYVCEPILNGEYRIHSATCGELYWHQAWHTCVREVPEDAECEMGDVVTAEPVPTPDGKCPYKSFGSNKRFFWIENDLNSKQHCVQGMIFNDEACSCIRSNTEEIEPTCSDDLLLHVPYDDHYNDVTCHQAIGTQYGSNVALVPDPDRSSNVACFGGETYFEFAFIRTWFANQKVTDFTISVWVKRQGDQIPLAGIVNNGDCEDAPGFELSAENNGVFALINTEDGEAKTDNANLDVDTWVHTVWRYDGDNLELYVDGQLARETSASGYMSNTDVPMRVAAYCDLAYFVGCMDELRIYTKALSPAAIQALSQQT